MAERVAVVGGGPLGLIALKTLIEDGFDVTLFETRSYVGGLWKASTDDSISVADNTVFNSSRFRTPMTDFPVPDDMVMDDFPTARQLFEYFQRYTKHFDLWPHIKLNSRVDTARRRGDEWELDVSSTIGSERKTERFDKVVFSCGSFIRPRQPTFDGIEKFQGAAIHSIKYHDPAQFKDMNVLVVGLHASAQDAVVSLDGVAKKVYLSHRSGIRLIPNYMPDGTIYDRQPSLGLFITMNTIDAFFPRLWTWLIDKALKKMSTAAFGEIPGSYGFEPVRSSAVQTPLVADKLYRCLQSGFVESIPEVACVLGPRSIQLKSDRILEDVDGIIYCTGYDSCIPVAFEPADVNPYPYIGAEPDLYRNVFSLHPDPAIRESIAFLGQVAAPLPGFCQYEVLCMSISQIWQHKATLPSYPEMKRWRRKYIRWRRTQAERYGVSTTFYSAFVPMSDHLAWLDKTAGLGIVKRLGLVQRWTNLETWKLWWREPRLYAQILNGFCSPAVYRIFDEGKRKPWTGARKQIFLDDEAINEAGKRKAMDKEKDKKL